MPKRGNLAPALAISLLLHGLLLWPATAPRTGESAAPPLAAVLRPSAAAPPARPSPVAVPRAPANRATPAPSRPEAQSPAAPVASNSTAEAPLRSGTSSGRAGDGVDAVPAAAPQAAGAGLDADGVRQYRLALAAQASRYKRYPPRALAEGVGGTVEIRVAVAAGGLPQEVRLTRTSGHDLLDAAALGMMRQAAPRTSVPEALRGRAFAVSLPVVFDPAEE